VKTSWPRCCVAVATGPEPEEDDLTEAETRPAIVRARSDEASDAGRPCHFVERSAQRFPGMLMTRCGELFGKSQYEELAALTETVCVHCLAGAETFDPVVAEEALRSFWSEEEGPVPVGEFLRRARELRNLAVSFVAGLAKISNSHLARLESGKKQLTNLALIADLAAILRISPEHLVVMALRTYQASPETDRPASKKRNR
jgi:helix-turn-helix protein